MAAWIVMAIFIGLIVFFIWSLQNKESSSPKKNNDFAERPSARNLDSEPQKGHGNLEFPPKPRSVQDLKKIFSDSSARPLPATKSSINGTIAVPLHLSSKDTASRFSSNKRASTTNLKDTLYPLREELQRRNRSSSQPSKPLLEKAYTVLNKKDSTELGHRLVPFVKVEDLSEALHSWIESSQKKHPEEINQIRLQAAWLQETNRDKTFANATGTASDTLTAIVCVQKLMENFQIATGVLRSSGNDNYLRQRFEGGLEFAKKNLRLSIGSCHFLAMEHENQDLLSGASVTLKIQEDLSKYPPESAQRRSLIDNLERDLSSALGISPMCIITQDLTPGSIVWNFVIIGDTSTNIPLSAITPKLQKMVKQKDPKLYSGQIMSRLDCNFFQLIHVPLFNQFELCVSDFNTVHNRDYTTYTLGKSTEKRGGMDFYPPVGFYRHAIMVDKKYPGKDIWLGMTSALGEWPVGYHGTKQQAVKSITKTGFKMGNTDAYRSEACILDTKTQSFPGGGVYCAPDVSVCEGDGYCAPIQVSIDGVQTTYLVAFMCRVEPQYFTQHNPGSAAAMKNGNRYWRVMRPESIRPYGLLVKVAR